MIKNKKGFTVLELLLAFSLAMIVIVYLFQIVSLVQILYADNQDKSALLVKQNNLVEAIYQDIGMFEQKGEQLRGIAPCNGENNCYTFQFFDQEDKTLKAYTNASSGKKYIAYGNYVVEYPKNTTFGNLVVDRSSYLESDGIYGDSAYDTIVHISMPITLNDYREQYDLNIVYQYNSKNHPDISINV